MSTISGGAWQGLFDEPRSTPAQEFERLRARRNQLRDATNISSRDARAAQDTLDRAQRATRQIKAKYAALGGPADDVKTSEKELQKAERDADRASERERDSRDALEFLEREVAGLVDAHADELLRELSENADQARRAAAADLALSRSTLNEYTQAISRQELFLTSTGRADIRNLRAPVTDLKQLARSLDELIARLPAAALSVPTPPPSPVVDATGDQARDPIAEVIA